VKFYACGNTRHIPWKCLEKKNRRTREDHIFESHERNVEIEMKVEATKEGRSFMMRKRLSGILMA